MKTFKTITVFCIIQFWVGVAAACLFFLPAAPCLIYLKGFEEPLSSFESVSLITSILLIGFLVLAIIIFAPSIIAKIAGRKIKILKGWVKKASETNVSCPKKDKGPTQF